MSPPEDPSSPVGGATRMLPLAGLSAFGMGVGMMPFFALGVLAPYLREDLALSPQAMGALPSAMFVVAAVASGWAGRMIDRRGPRMGLGIVFACGTTSWTVVAQAQSLLVVVLGIALGGGALAFAVPSVTRLLVGVATGRRLGVALGLAHSGAQLGAIVVGVLLPSLSEWLGWRIGLRLLAALPVAGLVLALLLVPRRDAASGRIPPTVAPRRSLGKAFPTLRHLAVFALIANGIASAGVLNLPTFGHEALGLSVVAAGLLTALIGVSSAIGKVAWGVLSVQLTAARSLASLLTASGIGVLLLGTSPFVTAALLVLGTAVFGASMTTWTVPTTRFAAVATGPQHSAGAAGTVMVAGYAGGALGPLVYGQAVAFGSYSLGWGALLLLIMIAALPVHALRASGL